MPKGNRPSENAVRGQLREERERVADRAAEPADNGATDAAAEKKAMEDEEVAKVETARSAEAEEDVVDAEVVDEGR